MEKAMPPSPIKYAYASDQKTEVSAQEAVEIERTQSS